MSLKKIAEKVGVSTATVSRVLNNPNYKCSTSQTREKIWEIAMEMNYAPNEAARNLKKGKFTDKEKMYYIHVLVTRMDTSQADPFYAELLHVIESEIHRQSCILTKVMYQSVFSNDRKCKTENLDRIIEEMREEEKERCDGLIIMGKCNEEALKKLSKVYKSVVSVNRNSTNYEIDEVLCDGYKVAATAVEYLVELGHKKIGYVGEFRNEARYKGFIDTLHKHGLEFDENYLIETKQTETEGYEVMNRMLQSGEYPTGIYCANDITAIGMLKCLSKYKNLYYIPSIIASDDIDAAQYAKPMLTTVRLPKEEMGKFAIYLLVDRMRGGHKSVVRTELEGRLVIRSSCTKAEESGWCEYYI